MIDQASLKASVQNFMSIPKVIDASIVSHDGLIMTSTTDDTDLSDIIGAMSSELISKGKQSVRELDLGDLYGNILFGIKGAIMTRVINEEMVVLVRVEPGVDLNAVFTRMNQVVRNLAID